MSGHEPPPAGYEAGGGGGAGINRLPPQSSQTTLGAVSEGPDGEPARRLFFSELQSPHVQSRHKTCSTGSQGLNKTFNEMILWHSQNPVQMWSLNV